MDIPDEIYITIFTYIVSSRPFLAKCTVINKQFSDRILWKCVSDVRLIPHPPITTREHPYDPFYVRHASQLRHLKLLSAFLPDIVSGDRIGRDKHAKEFVQALIAASPNLASVALASLQLQTLPGEFIVSWIYTEYLELSNMGRLNLAQVESIVARSPNLSFLSFERTTIPHEALVSIATLQKLETLIVANLSSLLRLWSVSGLTLPPGSFAALDASPSLRRLGCDNDTVKSAIMDLNVDKVISLAPKRVGVNLYDVPVRQMVNSLLRRAVSLQRPDLVRQLIEAYRVSTAPLYRGGLDGPLLASASTNSIPNLTLEYLLDAGLNPLERIGHDNGTVLLYAVRECDIFMNVGSAASKQAKLDNIRILFNRIKGLSNVLEAAFPYEDSPGTVLVHEPTLHSETVRALLDGFFGVTVPVNQCNSNGTTPLHVMRYSVDVLLAFQANPYAKDNAGQIPLVTQAKAGYNDNLAKLIHTFDWSTPSMLDSLSLESSLYALLALRTDSATQEQLNLAFHNAVPLLLQTGISSVARPQFQRLMTGPDARVRAAMSKSLADWVLHHPPTPDNSLLREPVEPFLLELAASRENGIHILREVIENLMRTCAATPTLHPVNQLRQVCLQVTSKGNNLLHLFLLQLSASSYGGYATKLFTEFVQTLVSLGVLDKLLEQIGEDGLAPVQLASGLGFIKGVEALTKDYEPQRYY